MAYNVLFAGKGCLKKKRMFCILDNPGNYEALKEKFYGGCGAGRKRLERVVQKGFLLRESAEMVLRSSGGLEMWWWEQTQLAAGEVKERIQGPQGAHGYSSGK